MTPTAPEFPFVPQSLQNSSFTSLCWQKWEQCISCCFTQLRFFWANRDAEEPQPPSQHQEWKKLRQASIAHPRRGWSQLRVLTPHPELPTHQEGAVGDGCERHRLGPENVVEDCPLVWWLAIGRPESHPSSAAKELHGPGNSLYPLSLRCPYNCMTFQNPSVIKRTAVWFSVLRDPRFLIMNNTS